MANKEQGGVVQRMDGVEYRLAAPYDFDFLKKYGRVFHVFDDQDSGNICFGVCDTDGSRYFVKFAGAPTESYDGLPEDAVERLKATLPIYMDLKHPGLIQLLDAQDVAGGFAMVFRWAEGDCMGRMYPAQHHRFMNLPVEARLQVFRDVLAFLEYVHDRGYVAIDFYDGSVMYDACDREGATVTFERNEITCSCYGQGKTSICDIDFFGQKPYYNHMGRMWGSSSFMSPEEFALGAELDEVTNVYTAGAFAFALFGGYRRDFDNWTLAEACYEVAKKAVSDDRGSRQQSLRQLIREWEDALQYAKDQET